MMPDCWRHFDAVAGDGAALRQQIEHHLRSCPNATATIRSPGRTIGALAGSLQAVPPWAVTSAVAVDEDAIDVTVMLPLPE